MAAACAANHIGSVVRSLKAGQVEYRVDKTANVHVPIGKVSFDGSALADNLQTLLDELLGYPGVPLAQLIDWQADWIARGLPARAEPMTYSVYRRRKLRRPKLEVTFAGGTDGDGLAGVREPRRPLPAPPSLRAALDLPAYDQD